MSGAPSCDADSRLTGRWSEQEHTIFLEGLKTHGKDWSVIARSLPQRTIMQIRTHAQKYFLKEQRAGGQGAGGYREASRMRATSEGGLSASSLPPTSPILGALAAPSRGAMLLTPANRSGGGSSSGRVGRDSGVISPARRECLSAPTVGNVGGGAEQTWAGGSGASAGSQTSGDTMADEVTRESFPATVGVGEGAGSGGVPFQRLKFRRGDQSNKPIRSLTIAERTGWREGVGGGDGDDDAPTGADGGDLPALPLGGTSLGVDSRAAHFFCAALNNDESDGDCDDDIFEDSLELDIDTLRLRTPIPSSLATPPPW